MADACLVHRQQSFDELLHVELHNRHWKSARVLDVAEHVTVWSKFVSDAGQWLIAILFDEGFDRSSSKSVRCLRREFYFSVERFHRHVWCVLEYFEGKVLFVLLCFENLSCSAGANFSQQPVASDCSLSLNFVFSDHLV